MTDTTITALLGELREVDEETFVMLDDIDSMIMWNAPNAHEGNRHPLDELVLNSVIQGCIQRAIAAKPRWYYCILKFSENDDRYHAIVEPPLKPQCQCDADTPAAAILAAYIEAVRASK